MFAIPFGNQKTMKKTYNNFFVLFAGLFFFTSDTHAQLGGDKIYQFLNLSSSARISALGGNLITVSDNDANLAFHNPALLNPTMNDHVSFGTNILFSGIHHGYASFARQMPRLNSTMHFGIQFINYGTFDQADIFGNLEGTFKASEYAITAGIGRQLYERLSVGANLKTVISQLESYNSFGLTGDIAALYADTSTNFTATLLFKKHRPSV